MLTYITPYGHLLYPREGSLISITNHSWYEMNKNMGENRNKKKISTDKKWVTKLYIWHWLNYEWK